MVYMIRELLDDILSGFIMEGALVHRKYSVSTISEKTDIKVLSKHNAESLQTRMKMTLKDKYD